jgi:uncharacterized membrane protein YagU involved in acid resistance
VNTASWLLWGFAATVVLTTVMAASQGLGLTRMNIPFMLGTMFTCNRDRAQPIGVVLHLLNGWIFSLVYIAAFHAWPTDWPWPQWIVGVCIGLVHALFVLAVAMPILPGMHPNMASSTAGPSARRRLEPPGFLALHYGVRTPISVVLAHLVFGLILGVLYRVP